MTKNKVSVCVWGDFACFTRPEMKVERVSYPIITPSAARGILEAIFWEPQMYYVVHEIAVVKRGNWFSFRRNEVQSVISISNAKSWMKGTKNISYIAAGGGAQDATQRNTLALMDVGYVVTAEIRLTSLSKPPRDNLNKYLELVRKRIKGGKCFHRPYLGCREFAADFEIADDNCQNIENWSDELGWMLYDVFDPNERNTGFAWSDDKKDGRQLEPSAIFFNAAVKNGVMNCNPEEIKILRSSK